MEERTRLQKIRGNGTGDTEDKRFEKSIAALGIRFLTWGDQSIGNMSTESEIRLFNRGFRASTRRRKTFRRLMKLTEVRTHAGSTTTGCLWTRAQAGYPFVCFEIYEHDRRVNLIRLPPEFRSDGQPQGGISLRLVGRLSF